MAAYTVALLIGRALHLAVTGSRPSTAVSELRELADGHAEALVAACRHYDALLCSGSDRQSARALHLLRLALLTARPPTSEVIGGATAFG